jgi:hypothetical protein
MKPERPSSLTRIVAAIACLVVSAVALIVGITTLSIWGVADGLREATQPAGVQVMWWLYASAAMLQVVLAGPVCRIVTRAELPKARVVFAAYSLGTAAWLVYLFATNGAPLTGVSIGVLALAVWLTVRLKETWLGWLSYAWAAAVVLVLVPAAYGAALSYSLLWLVTITAAVVITWVVNRLPSTLAERSST